MLDDCSRASNRIEPPAGDCFASPLSKAGLPHVFSKQLPGLLAITEQGQVFLAPLGRFRVGLMT
jgi:hypothetical protein